MSGAMNFKNCGSVLVSGASRGLGLQIVESLANGGFSPGKIIDTSRDPARAQKLQELAEKHPNSHIITLDVVKQESINRSVEEVRELENGLNCLINNVGINVVADCETVTVENMMDNFQTNAVAPLMITSALNVVSHCMAVDLKPVGILCVAIHPGWVQTDMRGTACHADSCTVCSVPLTPPLSTEESISAVLSVIGGLTGKDLGSFLNFTGEQLPW